MKHRTKLFLGGALALGLAAAAFAQAVVQTSVTGNEVWVAAQGPGGPGTYIGINTVRNGSGITTATGAGSPTTTGTQATSTFYWIGTAPTAWTVKFPNPAFDGEVVTLDTDTNLQNIVSTTTATTPQTQTIASALSSGSVTALTPQSWQYKNSTSTWLRIK